MEMSILCFGMLLGLPHLEMAGWGGIYMPQHNSSRWRKVAAFCGTPDSPMPLSGAPSHWTWHCRWPLALQAFTPDSPRVTPDSLVASLRKCHHELAVGLQFPDALDSAACGTGQSGALSQTVHRSNTILRFLDFAWYFFYLLVIFIMSSFEVLLYSMP
jgi:hypothetical protein